MKVQQEQKDLGGMQGVGGIALGWDLHGNLHVHQTSHPPGTDPCKVAAELSPPWPVAGNTARRSSCTLSKQKMQYIISGVV